MLQALSRESIMGNTAFLACLVILLPEVTLKACPPWARIVLCIVRTPALVEAKKKRRST